MKTIDRKAATRLQKRAQLTVEYAVMFTVIVAAVIWAGRNVIRPSVNRFFVSTGNIINSAAEEIEDRY